MPLIVKWFSFLFAEITGDDSDRSYIILMIIFSVIGVYIFLLLCFLLCCCVRYCLKNDSTFKYSTSQRSTSQHSISQHHAPQHHTPQHHTPRHHTPRQEQSQVSERGPSGILLILLKKTSA